jgi:hypothetical protein
MQPQILVLNAAPDVHPGLLFSIDPDNAFFLFVLRKVAAYKKIEMLAIAHGRQIPASGKPWSISGFGSFRHDLSHLSLGAYAE